MLSRSSLSLTAAIVCAGLTAAAPAGPIWDCSSPTNPGGTPATSEAVTGSGPVATIRCQLGHSTTGSVAGVQFVEEHMYLIRISEPADFSAITIPPFDGLPFNTQLWLFDSSGRGVLANNNAHGETTFSALGPESSDGSGAGVVQPGLYYLAISSGAADGEGRIPVSASGPIFDFKGDPTQISGPDGLGGADPVIGWIGAGDISGGNVGSYHIELTGVEFIDAIPTLSQWGMIALALVLLGAGAWLIYRTQQRAARAAMA